MYDETDTFYSYDDGDSVASEQQATTVLREPSSSLAKLECAACMRVHLMMLPPRSKTYKLESMHVLETCRDVLPAGS